MVSSNDVQGMAISTSLPRQTSRASLFKGAILSSAITLLAACGGSSTNEGDPIEQPTRAVFDLATRQFPVPNDFLFAAQEPADGTMSAGESDNPVIQGIDAMDGASLLAPIDIRFDAALNPAQNLSAAPFVVAQGNIIPNPQQNVFLLPLVYPAGNPLRALDNEIPSLATAIAYQSLAARAQGDDQEDAAAAVAELSALAVPAVRADVITLDGEINQTLRIQPLEPLEPKTRYLVAITEVEDAAGNLVAPSISYDFLSNPDSVFATAQADLLPAAVAVRGWESLANGYFGFMQTVYDLGGVPSQAPLAEDLIFTLTFTTTAVEDVLQSVAAPETFFATGVELNTRQTAIGKLMDGTYNLQGDASELADMPFDAAVVQQLNLALTTPGSSAYNPNIAQAIEAGATLAAFTSDPSAIFLLQSAVGEVAVQVTNAGPTPIALQGAGAVQNITAGVGAAAGAALTVDQVFQTPAERNTSFYRQDSATSYIGPNGAAALVYQGAIELPQYQDVDPTAPQDIYTSRWEANTTIAAAVESINLGSDRISYSYPFPTKKGDLNVPVLATVPAVSALKPADGWPVIIFVHGITSDRSSSVPMSVAMASACINPQTGAPIPGVPCFASVAIDQPLHGIAARASIDVTADGSLTALLGADANIAGQTKPADLTERHFGFTAAADGSPVPMSEANPGASGSLFINLAQFDNVRDNLRQMVMDLLNVNASLGSMDVDGDGTPDFDTDRVYLVGHSLGGIDGLPFVAINNLAVDSSFSDLPKIQAASAMLSGGELTRLLSNSPSFAARIQQGLFAASDGLLAPLTANLETYFSVFQGVLDSVDPTPYGPVMSDANNDTGVLLYEVVGNGDSLPDQTIPNAADSRWNDLGGNDYGPYSAVVPETGFMVENIAAPLAGTEPMVAAFGAIPSNDASLPGDDADPAVLVTRFTSGNHGTPVSAEPLDVFSEMVSQHVQFFTGNGNVAGSIVTDTSLVKD